MQDLTAATCPQKSALKQALPDDGLAAITSTAVQTDTRATGLSLFPDDALAHIFKPGRSVMTSGSAPAKGWCLAFERRRSRFIEPLMGWTGDNDPLTQVELRFPTLLSAIRYADRQGLRYVVRGFSGNSRPSHPKDSSIH